MARVFCIEDEPALAEATAESLRRAGHVAVAHANGGFSLDDFLERGFDAITLGDLRQGAAILPLLAQVVALQAPVPVFVSPLLRGLDNGRRPVLDAHGSPTVGSLEALIGYLERLDSRVDTIPAITPERDRVRLTAGRVVAVEGQLIALTARERRLLEYFMALPMRLLDRAKVIRDVWGYQFDTCTNLLDVHICRIRRKIDLPGRASHIQTVRGLGFVYLP